MCSSILQLRQHGRQAFDARACCRPLHYLLPQPLQVHYCSSTEAVVTSICN